MATDFILAPNARWQGRDQTGQPVQDGKLYTYLNQTTTPKATYQDYQGLQPNTNPVILDGKGEANIYWAVDDLYTIKLYTADDQEVYTQDNYPVVGTNTTRVVSESESNIVRNNQFSNWYYGTNFSPVSGVGSAANQDYICDDWYYSRVGTGYTVNITQQTFAIDQTEVPGNPLYYFRYQATSAPSGETNNRLWQTYKSVQTLAGQEVTVALRAKSPTASTINVYLVQNFGSGGAPSAEVATLVGQFDLTTSWELYQGTITIPTLAGKTLGSNGDDYLSLRCNYPNDVVATVDVTNFQFQTGASLSSFPFQSQETQFQELVNRIQDGVASTGDVKPTFKTVASPGWLLCNDTTIGNTGSGATTVGFYTKALYTLLWNNISTIWAPIYDSAGLLTTRGASAEADFNALKRLLLTHMVGRVISAAGQGSFSQPFTADPATDFIIPTTTVNNLFYIVNPVVLTTTGTLPAPLALATTYYVQRQSNTQLKIATSVSNCINGSFIDITDAGTGTHTITLTYSQWDLGQATGEENHGLNTGQIPSHHHIYGRYQVNGGGAQLQGGATYDPSYPNADSGDTGGSDVHPNLQPTVNMNYQIKL